MSIIERELSRSLAAKKALDKKNIINSILQANAGDSAILADQAVKQGLLSSKEANDIFERRIMSPQQNTLDNLSNNYV